MLVYTYVLSKSFQVGGRDLTKKDYEDLNTILSIRRKTTSINSFWSDVGFVVLNSIYLHRNSKGSGFLIKMGLVSLVWFELH